jgi:[ribosomal protein S5]-alanine N-acetyltransferase
MAFHLETPRLIIRLFREEDIPLFVAVHQKPEVITYLPKRSAEEHTRFLHDTLSYGDIPLNRWVIEEKSTGNFIGSCLLREFDNGNPEVIEIGYSFDSPYWGKGYGTEMARALKEYAFTLPQVKKLVAVTESENTGSKAVLLKIGLIAKGTVIRYPETLELDYFECEKK